MKIFLLNSTYYGVLNNYNEVLSFDGIIWFRTLELLIERMIKTKTVLAYAFPNGSYQTIYEFEDIEQIIKKYPEYLI